MKRKPAVTYAIHMGDTDAGPCPSCGHELTRWHYAVGDDLYHVDWCPTHGIIDQPG